VSFFHKKPELPGFEDSDLFFLLEEMNIPLREWNADTFFVEWLYNLFDYIETYLT
jgi:hypothetical protein